MNDVAPTREGPRHESILTAPDNLAQNRLLVLAWTDHFFGDDYLAPRTVALSGGRRIELIFTEDRQRLNEVDAVWFHGPSIVDMPPQKRCPWVLMSMESDVNYPALNNPIVRLRFDLMMTYRLDSDVPCIYPNWAHYGTFMERRARHIGPSPGALASYIASNPVPDRDEYVRRLMAHVPIDSLGSCLNNARIDGFVTGGWGDGAWDSLMSVLPRYKFYLAFENSQTTDYVTERVFHALACGVVPIYRGADNVRDFMPAPEAIIDVADFDSPEALARYLMELDQEDAAYQRHLAWKEDGYSAAFGRLVDLGSVEPRDRLAIKLAHGCDRACRCGGRLRDLGAAP